jgi:hypothetical protein
MREWIPLCETIGFTPTSLTRSGKDKYLLTVAFIDGIGHHLSTGNCTVSEQGVILGQVETRPIPFGILFTKRYLYFDGTPEWGLTQFQEVLHSNWGRILDALLKTGPNGRLP